jgi:hypothetical protein
MNVGQLRKIIVQYPLDCRLVMTVEGKQRLETTIREFLLLLIAEDDRDIYTLCGYESCIFRERMDSRGGEATIPQSQMWLEMDLR